jgi:glycosyltransferase involved in cell wall biosynthesis
MSKVPLSVIILTYNEELNIRHCLESVNVWADEIFIVDSFSTDKTIEIAKGYTNKIHQNKFVGYPNQRNWALDNLPFSNEWVFFLDADERPSNELKSEISNILLETLPDVNGFYVKWKFIFMGQWIKRGYYPTWVLRLFRYRKGYFEDRSVNEHIIVEGKVGYLDNDFIHEDLKSITEWIARQNRFASLEAEELFNRKLQTTHIEAKLYGSQPARKRWLRYNIWNKLPPLIRPFLYFSYRYFFRGGFLDGRKAFIYHFLQGLWVPFLIDVKYLEIKEREKEGKTFDN